MSRSKTESAEQREYPLRQIYFYLTEGCNLRCRHCWLQPKYQTTGHTYPALSLDLFGSIIEQAKPLGLSGVKLTGGEPLLHPRIHEMLGVVRDEGLRLTVETNGVLCTPELAEKMRSCKKAFVSVSLDGADAETHEWVRGVKGCFEAALNGVRTLVNAGLRPQIIMTVMRRNKDHMEAVVRLAESLGAGSVKFNIVQPIARGEKMHETRDTLTIEELVELGEWVENTLSVSADLRIFHSHPLAFRPLSRAYGDRASGCGICGILGIIGVLADGSYALCGIGETVPDLVFGQADRDRLEDIWENTAVLNELRAGLPGRVSGICADCLMQGTCLGNCIALNYSNGGNLWAPFWYCERARKAGLFPEARMRPISRV